MPARIGSGQDRQPLGLPAIPARESRGGPPSTGYRSNNLSNVDEEAAVLDFAKTAAGRSSTKEPPDVETPCHPRRGVLILASAWASPPSKCKNQQGKFILELYPDKAPKTVEMFLYNVKTRYD